MTRKRRKAANKVTRSASAARQDAAAPPFLKTRWLSKVRRVSRPSIWVPVVVTAALAFVATIAVAPIGDRDGGLSTLPEAAYVGSETCAGCHQAEGRLWAASQHKAAMQHASEQTVLGNFNDVGFDHYGVHSRFFRKDGKFLVETDGADGKLAVFDVKYTFGVDPLQQYLVAFPDGRLQALPIAWDSRPAVAGGQRWFHLSPNEAIRHDDILHWTGPNQNWNFMCAECHSTGVRKNYDPAHDRFATTWAEISVGCETCHGQGSRHVAWADRQRSWWPRRTQQQPDKGLLVNFNERLGVTWPIDARTGRPGRSSAPALLRKEVETCGLCHARRASLREDWIPGEWLSQTHSVEALTRTTYHADGQIRDVEEPYNYTPFKQGRMFAAGVTCSDCHEPHSAKLRLPGEGVCLQCHASDKYADVTHRHHAAVDPAPTCISCHMPTRTYMGIDVRHDHTFRIPRPDLSVSLGTPNACNDCHRDKTAQWSAATVDRWFGSERKGFQTYGPAFHAARNDQADANALLSVLAEDRQVPGVARASALGELASRLRPANVAAARPALADPDPMVRIGALDMLESLPVSQTWPLASPLLADSVRGVRIRAAALLAPVQVASLPEADRARFERAADEFIAAQRAGAERPEARTALADFLGHRGRTAEAETEYRAALRLGPRFTTAAINLADLYRRTGRDDDSEAVLRATIATSPADAAVHHALGLALTRLRRPAEALTELRQASELEPAQARYAYVYAVALHSAGRAGEAMTVLTKGLEDHPGQRDMLSAALLFSREAGNAVAALGYAERLATITPDDRSLAALIAQIRRQIDPPTNDPDEAARQQRQR